MFVRYSGPSQLDFNTLGISLIPGEDGEPGQPVQVPDEHVETVRAQAGVQGGLLIFLDGEPVVSKSGGETVELTEVEPPKSTVTLRFDFDGSVTPPTSRISYGPFLAGEPVEVAPADVEEITAALPDGLAVVNVDEALGEAGDADLDKLRKPELQALAESLGLEADGKVDELRERIAAEREQHEHPTEPAETGEQDGAAETTGEA